MSIHPSLRGVDTLVGERSVFSRVERIQILTKQGKFKPEESSVHGLPKVRTRFKSAVAKKVKAKAEDAAPAAAAAPAPAPEAKKGGAKKSEAKKPAKK